MASVFRTRTSMELFLWKGWLPSVFVPSPGNYWRLEMCLLLPAGTSYLSGKFVRPERTRCALWSWLVRASHEPEEGPVGEEQAGDRALPRRLQPESKGAWAGPGGGHLEHMLKKPGTASPRKMLVSSQGLCRLARQQGPLKAKNIFPWRKESSGTFAKFRKPEMAQICY